MKKFLLINSIIHSIKYRIRSKTSYYKTSDYKTSDYKTSDYKTSDCKASGTSFKSSLKLLECLKNNLNIKLIKTCCKTNNGFIFNEVAKEERRQEIYNLTGSATTV